MGRSEHEFTCLPYYYSCDVLDISVFVCPSATAFNTKYILKGCNRGFERKSTGFMSFDVIESILSKIFIILYFKFPFIIIATSIENYWKNNSNLSTENFILVYTVQYVPGKWTLFITSKGGNTGNTGKLVRRNTYLLGKHFVTDSCLHLINIYNNSLFLSAVFLFCLMDWSFSCLETYYMQ